jgi:hypothetical protein
MFQNCKKGMQFAVLSIFHYSKAVAFLFVIRSLILIESEPNVWNVLFPENKTFKTIAQEISLMIIPK